MKYKYIILLTLITLIFPALGYTAEKISTVDSLTIELWPDYDQASVLVLVTGTLPGNTVLPATVTLPLPKKARLHAIARIDSGDGRMKDDFSYTLDSNKLTFDIPDLRFRLEYYIPYEAKDNQRSFNFTWLSDLTVNNFQAVVQQPKSAGAFTTDPAVKDVTMGGDGLNYHAFPKQKVPAGQSFSLQVNYTAVAAKLTSTPLPSPTTNLQTPEIPYTSSSGVKSNRALIFIALGAAFIILILVWKITSWRDNPSIPLTTPEKTKKQTGSKFCHNCGNPVEKNNKFCIKCGTALLR